MKKLLFFFTMLTATLLFAEITFSEPKPSMFNPRKFIFPISTANEKELLHIIGTTSNVIESYGANNCEVIIVAYADGIKSLQKDADFKDENITKRIKGLILANVQVMACKKTLKSRKINEKELLEDVEVVDAGVVEIIERQVDGYVYLRP